MRGILIDWLIEVYLHFKLRHETLFITGPSTSWTATSLSRRSVHNVYICANAYTRYQIVKMEQMILQTLFWFIGASTIRQAVWVACVEMDVGVCVGVLWRCCLGCNNTAPP